MLFGFLLFVTDVAEYIMFLYLLQFPIKFDGVTVGVFICSNVPV